MIGGVLLLAYASRAHAQESSAFPFEGWHARAAALGGAGVALQGLEFTPLTPAAAAGHRGTQLSRHLSPADAEDTGLAVAHSGRFGTVSLLFRRRDWGEVAKDLGLEDLSAGEQAVGFGYAHTLAGDRVRFGVSAARLDTDYLGARSSGWALDAGVQARAGAGITVGAALLHAGRITDDEDERVTLPTQVRGGAAWNGQLRGLGLTVAADAAVPREGSGRDLHAGAEARYTAGPLVVSGRGGFRSLGNPYGDDSSEQAWTVGGGAEFGRVRVDIAQAIGGTLGDETFLSLSLRW